MDGVPDEAAWDDAEALSFVVPGTFAAPQSATEVRLLYDRTNLYAAFRAVDPDVWGVHENPDDPLWEEDCVELFLEPENGGVGYYEFEFSPGGVLYDVYWPSRVGGSIARWIRWTCLGWQAKASVQGTFDDWRDRDEGWMAEFAIPFASLPTLEGRPPGPGDTWRFHAARSEYSIHLPSGVEYTSCARLTKAHFHTRKEWMRLRFETQQGAAVPPAASVSGGGSGGQKP